MCEHKDFNAKVTINRLGRKATRIMAEVRINCAECGKPFVFYGLPEGLDVDGASVSVDGTEARLSIGPKDTLLRPYYGAKGFTITHD